MNVLLASNNRHKRMEMDGILRGLGAAVRVIQPLDAGFSFDVVEDGTTFGENAFLKARALAMILRGHLMPGVSVDRDIQFISEQVLQTFDGVIPPVLADDSGVCVHALDNRPGVYSARYGNRTGAPDPDDTGRNTLLLEELRSASDRSAHYVCNAVLYYDQDRYLQVQETWHGEIAREPAYGETGFGYDPIFFIAEYGNTVARISQEQKDRISHRARALGAIARAAGWIDPCA